MRCRRAWRIAAVLAVGVGAGAGAAGAQEQWWDPSDPRVGLSAGWSDAGEASWNMELVANRPKPSAFHDPANPGDINRANSDLAFQGNLVFVGNFSGFNVYDVSDPANPTLRVSVVCPGGQGDVSVRGNLLFMSVEQTSGRVDCGTGGVPTPVSGERFIGVRIFDIADLDSPRQVAAVQTCRGSHTHTVLDSPGDPNHVYVLVSGTGGVRPAEELPGCSTAGAEEDPANTSLFRIEVIQVPLAAPRNARVVSAPRVFADRQTGAVAGLWPGGPHGEGTQASARTDHCHDITVYPDLGLAAGACSGNGILLDIRDPVNPVRLDEVVDENFAYWHSATFNNDGTTVLFTDEWGGGTSPRCRPTDPQTWGANAFFRLRDNRMEFAGYYKLPVPQTAQENCVAHNGSLVPVPGRDIKVQAWYQGGISVVDFTDPANPFEIAYFDRGPLAADRLYLGGQWSAYWYNGMVYGSEIGRGLDVLRLTAGEQLTQNELDAALLVRQAEFNPQQQHRIEWPAHPSVAKAYADQLARSGALSADRAAALSRELDRGAAARSQLEALARQFDADALGVTGQDALRFRRLADTLRGIAVAEN
jgi:hypothetical protein